MLQRIVRTLIQKEDAGRELLVFLSTRFTYHTAALWQELISEGRLCVNGIPAKNGMLLKDGMVLEYTPRPRPEPPVSSDIKVLHADNAFIVLDKPGDIPCHPAGCYFNNTVWAALKEGRVTGIPPMENVHFVSRLDRETSGLVLVARTANAARDGARLLARGDALKQYTVLVEGCFPPFMEAHGWLAQAEKSTVSKKRAFFVDKPSTKAETASTSFALLACSNGLSLLKATLGTGRTHQIRATLSSLGFPVVGDKIYGPDESIFLRFIGNSMTGRDRAVLRLPCQALHASFLAFGNYSFSSPYPQEWNELIGLANNL